MISSQTSFDLSEASASPPPNRNVGMVGGSNPVSAVDDLARGGQEPIGDRSEIERGEGCTGHSLPSEPNVTHGGVTSEALVIDIYENLLLVCSQCHQDLCDWADWAVETAQRSLAVLSTIMVLGTHLVRVATQRLRSWIRWLPQFHGDARCTIIRRWMLRRSASPVLAAGGKCALHVPRC